MISSTAWIESSAEKSLRASLATLWLSRPVFYALIKRDLSSRYRASFFGFAWAWSRPLIQLFVYAIIIGSILGASRSITNFAIYLFVGLMVWGFFSEALIVGTGSIVAGSGLITKISFPREILPLVSVTTALINTLIQLPVLMLGLLLTKAIPNLNLLPIALLIGFGFVILTLALVLFLSALNVYARDIQQLVEILLTLLMYLSPIIYSWTFVRDAIVDRGMNLFLFDLYMFNPVTITITTFQDLIWNGTRLFSNGQAGEIWISERYELAGYFLGGAIILFLMAYKFFIKLENEFAREL